ncbi:RagB/SusD family nutrient uptake outer membrane protein [Bacteroides fragilis]|nr:RagB/SusD family nutrient uptake outer membrane protein [Bacteroides fragilis]
MFDGRSLSYGLPKVTTSDNEANIADLAVAKQHLQSVIDNYGLSMMDNFSDVFELNPIKVTMKIIFAIRYLEKEKRPMRNVNYTYMNQGEIDKGGFLADGTPWNDPLGLRRVVLNGVSIF